jgi:release factor glutamine methyltransferase
MTNDERRTVAAISESRSEDALQWTNDEALAWGREQLAGTDEAELAAKMLLAHVRKCTLSELFMYPGRRLAALQRTAYQALIARRAAHEPLAYLVGHRGFLDLDLLVDQRVLIPRPETELLVDRAVAWARQRGHRDASPTHRLEGRGDLSPTDGRLTIVDVGTGSGAIAIGLAAALPQAQVYATDSSADALEVARQNAIRNGVADRIEFLEGDLLEPLRAAHAAVDLIVANLPYVTEDEYASLPPGIRFYEPRQALAAGPDGLDVIRRLLHGASPLGAAAHLAPGGGVLLEIGAAQGEAVRALAVQAFPRARVEVIPDHSGRDRVVEIVQEHDAEGTQRGTERKRER